MFFGITHPKMVALRARIGNAGAAHLLNFFQKRGIVQDGHAQVLQAIL